MHHQWIASDVDFKNTVNTLRPRQNGHHFPDDILKWIFLNENAWISIEISLKFFPKGQINNIPALVQIMAWRRPGDKPLSEPMMVSLLMHICVTRPQWVKCYWTNEASVCIYIYIFIYVYETKIKKELFSEPRSTHFTDAFMCQWVCYYTIKYLNHLCRTSNEMEWLPGWLHNVIGGCWEPVVWKPL